MNAVMFYSFHEQEEQVVIFIWNADSIISFWFDLKRFPPLPLKTHYKDINQLESTLKELKGSGVINLTNRWTASTRVKTTQKLNKSNDI